MERGNIARIATGMLGGVQLLSDDGAFIELAVAGYQYPSLPGGDSPRAGVDWDANWLVIRG